MFEIWIIFIVCTLSGLTSVTERLEKAIPGIDDVFFTVALSGPLMTDEQKQSLNPLVVKVHSATNMPDTPINYAELGMRYVSMVNL